MDIITNHKYHRPDIEGTSMDISYALMIDSLVEFDSDDIVSPGFGDEDWI